jgi:hypothetical protein
MILFKLNLIVSFMIFYLLLDYELQEKKLQQLQLLQQANKQSLQPQQQQQQQQQTSLPLSVGSSRNNQ